MSKIVCEKLKNGKLNTSFGNFTADKDGVFEVPDEFAENLLALDGYKLLDEKYAPKNAPSAQDAPKTPQSDKDSGEEQNAPKTAASDAQQGDTDQGDEDGDEQGDENIPENDEAVKLEELQEKNVAQLKKIAKDNNIDLAGASKKDEIISIILVALNK